MYIKKDGESLQLYHAGNFIAKVTNDPLCQSYVALVGDLRVINIEKARARHDGSLVLKAMRESESNSFEIQNLIGTGPTFVAKDGLGGFDDFVGYIEEKYLKGKNISKSLPRPSEVTAKLFVAKQEKNNFIFSNLSSTLDEMLNLLQNNLTEFERRKGEFASQLVSIRDELKQMVSDSPQKILQDVTEGRIGPVEVNRRIRDLEKTQRQNYLAKVLSPPSEISPQTIIERRDSSHPVSWKEIHDGQRYKELQQRKKFLDSFPKSEKPKEKFQAGGWGLSEEAEKRNQEMRERSGMPILIMKKIEKEKD